jgi:phosphoglycerate kinase (EC 2.7.2.3)
VREDFNVPVKQGVVTSMARIDAGLPTLRYLLDAGAQVAVMSHLGRPVEGVCEPEFSLAPVATALSERLGISVPLVRDWIDGFAQTTPLVLLENVRYLVGEGDDDPVLRNGWHLCVMSMSWMPLGRPIGPMRQPMVLGATPLKSAQAR